MTGGNDEGCEKKKEEEEGKERGEVFTDDMPVERHAHKRLCDEEACGQGIYDG